MVWKGGGEQVMLDGIVCGRDPRGKAQLAVDGADMRMDGTRADDQALGHLGIGEPLCQQEQYLHFASGQVVCRRACSRGARR